MSGKRLKEEAGLLAGLLTLSWSGGHDFTYHNIGCFYRDFFQ